MHQPQAGIFAGGVGVVDFFCGIMRARSFGLLILLLLLLLFMLLFASLCAFVLDVFGDLFSLAALMFRFESLFDTVATALSVSGFRLFCSGLALLSDRCFDSVIFELSNDVAGDLDVCKAGFVISVFSLISTFMFCNDFKSLVLLLELTSQSFFDSTGDLTIFSAFCDADDIFSFYSEMKIAKVLFTRCIQSQINT